MNKKKTNRQTIVHKTQHRKLTTNQVVHVVMLKSSTAAVFAEKRKIRHVTTCIAFKKKNLQLTLTNNKKSKTMIQQLNRQVLWFTFINCHLD